MRRPSRTAILVSLAFIIAICSALAAGLAVTAALNPPDRGEDVKNVREGIHRLIGVSQANLSEPWRIAMTEEIRIEAAKHPDMRVVVTDAVDSSERQVADVRKLLAYGIDLLIISPNESAALTPVVAEAYHEVPVIVLDRDVEGYDYTLYIGPDNGLVGRETGRYVSELLGARGGTVLEVQGRSGSPPTVDRSESLREEITRYPSIVIAPPVTADWLRDRAEDLLFERFKTQKAPDAVVAQNDAMAYGAALAAHRAGLSNIDIIGVDGLEGPNGGLDLVRRGVLSATFICPTGGKEAVNYAVDILDKKAGIPKKIYLRTRKVTARAAVAQEPLPSISSSAPVRAKARTRPIRLGFAQVGSESHWRLANTRSIVEAARNAGIDLYFEDGKQSQEVQIEAIRSFIRRGLDVIAFSPIVEGGWEDILTEAKEAGIPVILSDREVNLKNEELWATFVGSDFMEEGRRAARWLLGYMRGRIPEDGTVRIVELRGTEGSAPALDRKEGFESILSTHPEYRIIRSEVGNFTVDLGRDRMREILATEKGRIDVLFAHNDDMAFGAIEAIEEVGLIPGKDIIIVSVDAVREAFRAMIAGKLNCTVECTPLLGPQLMKVVQDYMDGVDLPTRIITSEEVFPAEVAREVIRERKY
jgi:simple sugar transport system substrate-binding protein